MNLFGVAIIVGCVFGCLLAVDGKKANSEKGTWLSWKDVTTCSARSCNCTGQVVNEKSCPKGLQLQTRQCKPHPDGTTCKAKKKGAIRLNPCKNPQETCPGWSDWMQTGNCSCGTARPTIPFQRWCISPSPIHNADHCDGDDDNDGIDEMEEDCKCEGIDPTEEAPEATPTLLPCCLEITTMSSYPFEITTEGDLSNVTFQNNTDYDYGFDLNANDTSNDLDLDSNGLLDESSEDDEDLGTPATERDPEVDDFYDEGVSCRPC